MAVAQDTQHRILASAGVSAAARGARAIFPASAAAEQAEHAHDRLPAEYRAGMLEPLQLRLQLVRHLRSGDQSLCVSL